MLTVAALLGVGFRLRMYLTPRSLWLDPSMLALNIVENSYGELFGCLSMNQAAPVGFLVLSKYIGSCFNYSELALCFVPFMFGMGALAVFLALAVESLGVRIAPIAFVPFAMSSTVVYYCGEFKQYSLDLFFATTIMFLAHRVVQNGFSRTWIGIWVALCVVGVWFSHASVFVSAGTGTALIVAALLSSKHSIKAVSWAIAGVSVHFVVVYFLQIRPTVNADLYAYYDAAYAPLLPISTDTINWWTQRFVGYGSFPLGFGEWVFLPLMLLVIGASIGPFESRTRLVTAIVGLPIVTTVAASICHLYPIAAVENDVHSRLMLFTAPSAYILIGLGLSLLSRLLPKPGLAIVGIGVLIAVPPIARMVAWPNYIRQEMKPLVRHLYDEMESGDSVYVYSASIPAFRFYTRENPISFTRGVPITDAAIDIPKDLARVLGNGRVWIVISHDYNGATPSVIQTLSELGWDVGRDKYPGAILIRGLPPGKPKGAS